MINWHFHIRREAPLFPAFGVTESFAHTDHALKMPFTFKNIRFVKYQWFSKIGEEKKLENLLKEKLLKKPAYFHDYVQRQKKAGESLKKYVRTISSAHHSETEMKAELHRYLKKMHAFYCFWWLAVPAGRIVEEEVTKMLAKHWCEGYFGNLIRSSETLELSKEQHALLTIGKKIKGTPLSELQKKDTNRLEQHAKKYGWLATTYHLGKPQTVEGLYEKIQASNPETELKALGEKEKKYKDMMKHLAQKVAPKERQLIKIMQDIIFSRNYQKETVNECQHRSEPFLKRVADLVGMPWWDFLHLTPKEAEQTLATRKIPSQKILDQRKRGYAVIIENGTCFVGDDVEKYAVFDNERDDIQTVSGIIKGQPGCRGKVVGTVRVIMKKEELDRFKAGEILVTSMTSIDFVPVMKKAKAIVTNEGGITCHAAIISRELNVPCVIGTNIATKVLKTGDVVEVDATNGTVRKL